jgi:hypothetical protein
MSNQKQFLVICRAGDRSLHSHWILDSARNFDLYISYFGDEPNKYIKEADYYEQVKGPKWPIIYDIIQNNIEIVSAYSAVWIPDDDILMSTQKINQMFNLFAGFEFDLAQPALTIDSYVKYFELVEKKGVLARHVNFVEVMAPIFSKYCLTKLTHTFNQSRSGWGLDYLWPVLLDYRNIAVLDATPMTHTRPLGGELYKKNALSPLTDMEGLAALYPHLNISKSKWSNKFHFFSSIKTIQNIKVIARLKAKIHKKYSKWRFKNSNRYSTPS